MGVGFAYATSLRTGVLWLLSYTVNLYPHHQTAREATVFLTVSNAGLIEILHDSQSVRPEW